MGFFDIFTDAFTGKPAKEAGAKNLAYLQGLQSDVSNLYSGGMDKGLAALTSGQGTAQDAINAAFAQARGDIAGVPDIFRAAQDPMIAALSDSIQNAQGALGSRARAAIDALQRGVGSAVDAYKPVDQLAADYNDRSSLASLMSENALGLRGAAGNQAATDAFRAGPGYEWMLNQGLDSVARMKNTLGMGASGNTLVDLQKYGSGLADQEFDDWLNRLQGREALYSPLGASLTGQSASGKANAYLTGGTGEANIQTGTAGRLADLYTQGGRDLASIYGGTASNIAGAQNNLASLAAKSGMSLADIASRFGPATAQFIQQMTSGQAGGMLGLADDFTGINNNMANAQLGGSKNLWNLIGGIGSNLASGGLSGLGSSMFSGLTGKNNLLPNYY